MQIEVMDLINLLKVFDANYAIDEDLQKIAGLDINDPKDIDNAVDALLMPEFSTYSEKLKMELVYALRHFLADPAQNFEGLFKQVGLIFDQPEPKDRRAFMAMLLAALEARGY